MSERAADVQRKTLKDLQKAGRITAQDRYSHTSQSVFCVRRDIRQRDRNYGGQP